MTYEEMERSMEFMRQHLVNLEQLQEESEQRRAKFDANVQRSMESMLQQQAKFASDLMQLKELGKDLAVNHIRMQNAIAELAVSHKTLAESHQALEKRLADSNESLTESQKKTDERLRTFLSALERRFGRNGRGRKSTS
jgi:predicted  nucleic acid-binding Zn-ribbon protein